jgi:hypothetical protein
MAALATRHGAARAPQPDRNTVASKAAITDFVMGIRRSKSTILLRGLLADRHIIALREDYSSACRGIDTKQCQLDHGMMRMQQTPMKS